MTIAHHVWPPAMILCHTQGRLRWGWSVKCRFENCCNSAPLLEPGALSLGAAQDMVVCLRTEVTPWTGERLGWILLMENRIRWPETVLELE